MSDLQTRTETIANDQISEYIKEKSNDLFEIIKNAYSTKGSVSTSGQGVKLIDHFGLEEFYSYLKKKHNYDGSFNDFRTDVLSNLIKKLSEEENKNYLEYFCKELLSHLNELAINKELLEESRRILNKLEENKTLFKIKKKKLLRERKKISQEISEYKEKITAIENENLEKKQELLQEELLLEEEEERLNFRSIILLGEEEDLLKEKEKSKYSKEEIDKKSKILSEQRQRFDQRMTNLNRQKKELSELEELYIEKKELYEEKIKLYKKIIQKIEKVDELLEKNKKSCKKQKKEILQEQKNLLQKNNKLYYQIISLLLIKLGTVIDPEEGKFYRGISDMDSDEVKIYKNFFNILSIELFSLSKEEFQIFVENFMKSFKKIMSENVELIKENFSRIEGAMQFFHQSLSKYEREKVPYSERIKPGYYLKGNNLQDKMGYAKDYLYQSFLENFNKNTVSKDLYKLIENFDNERKENILGFIIKELEKDSKDPNFKIFEEFLEGLFPDKILDIDLYIYFSAFYTRILGAEGNKHQDIFDKMAQGLLELDDSQFQDFVDKFSNCFLKISSESIKEGGAYQKITAQVASFFKALSKRDPNKSKYFEEKFVEFTLDNYYQSVENLEELALSSSSDLDTESDIGNKLAELQKLMNGVFKLKQDLSEQILEVYKKYGNSLFDESFSEISKNDIEKLKFFREALFNSFFDKNDLKNKLYSNLLVGSYTTSIMEDPVIFGLLVSDEEGANVIHKLLDNMEPKSKVKFFDILLNTNFCQKKKDKKSGTYEIYPEYSKNHEDIVNFFSEKGFNILEDLTTLKLKEQKTLGIDSTSFILEFAAKNPETSSLFLSALIMAYVNNNTKDQKFTKNRNFEKIVNFIIKNRTDSEEIIQKVSERTEDEKLKKILLKASSKNSSKNRGNTR